MHVDFTDLKKGWPKDLFLPPWIDLLVDETMGCALLNTMDTFCGYHKLFMEKEDEEKTTFITPYGVLFYLVMAFGFKKIGGLPIPIWL